MPNKLKYYFETNALYQLKHIDQSYQQSGFYSSFGLIELIAGIDPNNFKKRQAIISNIERSPLKFDGSMLELKLFESFDYLKDFEFNEERTQDLLQIKNKILTAQDYQNFLSGCLDSQNAFSYYDIRSLDSFFTTNFKRTTGAGMKLIKDTLLMNKNASLVFGGIRYDLSTKNGIDFFLSNPAINEIITINALAEAAQKNFLDGMDEQEFEKLINSYNGRLNTYVKTFSLYSKDQIVLGSNPSKNDQQDLYHLYYVTPNQKIISNDKIFKKYIPNQTINIVVE